MSDPRVDTTVRDRLAPLTAGQTGGRRVYSCFNFRLESDLPLDELRPAATGDRRSIVVVQLGRVAERLANASASVEGLQIAGPVASLTLPGIVQLRGQEAMAAIMANTYRGFWLKPMGLHTAHFRQCAALLSSVRVYAATRQWGFDCFGSEVDWLERHLFEEDPE